MRPIPTPLMQTCKLFWGYCISEARAGRRKGFCGVLVDGNERKFRAVPGGEVNITSRKRHGF